MSEESEFKLSEFVRDPESILKILNRIETSKQTGRLDDLSESAQTLVESLKPYVKNQSSIKILLAFVGLVALYTLTKKSEKRRKQAHIDTSTQSKLSGYIEGISYKIIKSIVDTFLTKCENPNKILIKTILASPVIRYKQVYTYLIDKYSAIETEMKQSPDRMNECKTYFRLEMFKQLPLIVEKIGEWQFEFESKDGDKDDYTLSPERSLNISKPSDKLSEPQQKTQAPPVAPPVAQPVAPSIPPAPPVRPAPPAPPLAPPISVPPKPEEKRTEGNKFGTASADNQALLKKIMDSCDQWTEELFGMPSPLENMAALKTLWSTISDIPQAPQSEYVRQVTLLHRKGEKKALSLWEKMLPTVRFADTDLLDDVAYWCFEENNTKTWSAYRTYLERTVPFAHNQVTKFLSEFLEKSIDYLSTHSITFVINGTWKQLNNLIRIVEKENKKVDKSDEQRKNNVLKLESQIRKVLSEEIKVLFKLNSASQLNKTLIDEMIPDIVSLADAKLMRTILKLDIDVLDKETSALYVLSGEKWSKTLQNFAETFKRIAKPKSAFRSSSVPVEGAEKTMNDVNGIINQTITEIVNKKVSSVSSYATKTSKGTKTKLPTREEKQLIESEKTMLINQLDSHIPQIESMYKEFVKKAQQSSQDVENNISNEVARLNAQLQQDKDLSEIKDTEKHMTEFKNNEEKKLTETDDKASTLTGSKKAKEVIDQEIKEYNATKNQETKQDKTYLKEVQKSDTKIDQMTKERVQVVEAEKKKAIESFAQRVRVITELDQKNGFMKEFGKIKVSKAVERKSNDDPSIFKELESEGKSEFVKNVKEFKTVEKGGDEYMKHQKELKDFDARINTIQQEGGMEKKEKQNEIFDQIRLRYVETHKEEMRSDIDKISQKLTEKSEQFKREEQAKLTRTFQSRLDDIINNEQTRIQSKKEEIRALDQKISQLGQSIPQKQKEAKTQAWNTFTTSLRKQIFKWLGIQDTTTQDRSIEDYELALNTVLPNLVTLFNENKIAKKMQPHLVVTFKTLKQKTQSPLVEEMALKLKVLG